MNRRDLAKRYNRPAFEAVHHQCLESEKRLRAENERKDAQIAELRAALKGAKRRLELGSSRAGTLEIIAAALERTEP